jgi:hypothetical protein
VDKNDCFSTKKYETLRDLKRHQANQELQRLHAAGFIRPVHGSFPRWLPQRGVMERVQVSPSASYPPLVCLRLLGEEDKANTLQEIICNASDPRCFVVTPEDFRCVPNTPFCYWVSSYVRNLYTELPRFESDERMVRVGLQSSYDYRFIRSWWEVLPANILDGLNSDSWKDKLQVFQEWCKRRTGEGKGWVPFAKGGRFSPHYADIHLLINWAKDGAEMKRFATSLQERLTSPPGNGPLRDFPHYFQPGLTWPRRTNGLSFRILPSGSIFADKGPAIFVADNSSPMLLALCGLLNSKAFRLLVSIQIARTELAQSYEVGLVQHTPVPDLRGSYNHKLSSLAQKAWTLKRNIDAAAEISHAFTLPALLQVHDILLNDRVAMWKANIDEFEQQIIALQGEIDDISFHLYGISGKDRQAIERFISGKQTTFSDKDEDDEDTEQQSADSRVLTTDLFSYALGCAFGRWDERYATGEKQQPPLPDPFAPLPECALGTLQGDDGLPLTSPDQLPEGYPLANIAWDGVLVDDPGHPKDLLAAVRAVFEVIWPDKADDIWREAAALVEAPAGDLRAWFRKSFFEEHKKRYSKSRRKAPIYWQLAVPSGSYSIWLYYHRFSKETFYGVLRYIKDKLDYEESKLAGLRSAAGDAPSRSHSREIDEQESFVAELRALREEVERITPLWNPNLNDGVIVNFAPLWRLVLQHRAWQKELRDCWKKLVGEEYEWAHLAMHLWPERVVPKCQTDASLAIAHGLEEVFWQQDEKGKWRRKDVDDATVKRLIEERTSPAVKAALKSLLEAPDAQNRSVRQRATAAEPQLTEGAVKTKRRKRAAKPKTDQTPTEGGMFEAEA